jgi:hypothetical protein
LIDEREHSVGPRLRHVRLLRQSWAKASLIGVNFREKPSVDAYQAFERRPGTVRPGQFARDRAMEISARDKRS